MQPDWKLAFRASCLDAIQAKGQLVKNFHRQHAHAAGAADGVVLGCATGRCAESPHALKPWVKELVWLC